MLYVQAAGEGRSRSYALARPFVTSLRMAITGGGEHRSFGVPFNEKGKDRVGITALDDFAREQWDNILNFVVGSVEAGGGAGQAIAPGSRALLESGNFVFFSGPRASITKEGFEFLLRDINAQVWSLLIVYLNEGQNHGLDNIEVLSFLFQLGSLEVGQAYSTDNLTESQLTTLDDLHDLGIVYRHPADSPRFYPTRLAMTLNSDSNSLSNSLGSALSLGGGAGAEAPGFIIVETNYRIYAYTNNPLRIAILSLFIKLNSVFPNMVTGKLTRSSVQAAIAQGITSHQIISYLTAHAHPVMANQSRSNQPNNVGNQAPRPSLPPTVVDQIRLWQIEGDRMLQTPGFLFKGFGNEHQYRALVEHADTIGVLVWKDDRKRVFFASKIESLKTFLAQYNASTKDHANGAS